MVRSDTYIHIEAFMRNKLNLKGHELMIYAIIYGFSQDGESEFKGSLNYISQWIGLSKKSCCKILQKLVDKKMIEKTVIYSNNVMYCKYRAILEEDEKFKKSSEGMEESSIPMEESSTGGMEESSIKTIRGNNKKTIRTDYEQARAIKIPSLEEATEYYHQEQLAITPNRFIKYMKSKKWKDADGVLIHDWRAAYKGIMPTPDEHYDPNYGKEKNAKDYWEEIKSNNKCIYGDLNF